MKRRLVLAFVALAGLGSTLGAQSYFGQNQVQYDRFDWEVLETEHFQIFYYPSEARAAFDASRMAERTYARLALVLGHQFREKKPIMLFSSRTDFGQNNVTGDLGEGTGGVTEALRHRMLLNFTGDYHSFEHVLAHEMVHAFQYDIFARGKAGNGMQALAQFLPPLWFAEGMAEYLSLGPSSALTDSWMRDAAMNGHIPTVKQMTDKPDDYFPYRYGHSFWTFVGTKFGDEAIGQIMNAVPTVGVDRAFNRELGESLETIGDEWREDLQTRLLAAVASLDRPRKFAQPTLTPRISDGAIFLAPTLSNDGTRIAFLANGSLVRGQVFIDLWLADARTGKRLGRLAPSATNADFEELRLLYSQSAFSPDGSRIAFTGQRAGRDILYVMRVDGRKIEHRFDNLPLESAMSPSWSPDGKWLVFSGTTGGMSNLYRINVDGTHFTQLTDDQFGELQPTVSPDGATVAFATDRGPGSRLDVLRFAPWQIALLDIATGAITMVPGQRGLNLNPQWAPDGRSIAYLSDRSGVANVYLYDFTAHQHYQLTNVAGGISGITEYSPAISWARGADRLAFTYFDNGQYTIWTANNPRALKRAPVTDGVVATTTKPPIAVDSTHDVVLAATTGSFFYHGSSGELRVSNNLPLTGDTVASSISIAALLDSAEIGLPDTTRFQRHAYHAKLQPDFTARPSIAYVPDASTGRNIFGGTAVVMSDLLGNHHLAASGELNGRISESRLFLGYTNLAQRWQYSAGFSQTPYYFLTADSLSSTLDHQSSIEKQEITTYVARQVFAVTAYPLNRFTRLEIGGGFNNVDRTRWTITRQFDGNKATTDFKVDHSSSDPTLNYLDGQLALVSDNTVFGNTSPLMGRRFRLQVSPVTGSFDWVQGLIDYRRYDPIIFSYLTLASRIYGDISVGPDEEAFPKYIARPDFVRGYDRNNSFNPCTAIGANPSNCNAVQLLGSRVAVANVELRFPLLRRVELGVVPVDLPPIDGLFFFDAGVAWSRHQSLYRTRPDSFDVASQRYPLRSYGTGLRLNLFNYAILRFDYAIPMDTPGHRGFWTWSLWPSF